MPRDCLTVWYDVKKETWNNVRNKLWSGNQETYGLNKTIQTKWNHTHIILKSQ